MSRSTPDTVWLDHRSGLAPLEEWCAAHPGGRCGVVLGAGLTLPLVVGPELPLADDPAVRAYARRVLAHYGQPVAALATWRSGRWRGAAALEGLDLPALREVAARHRVRLTGVWPAWAVALAAHRPRDRAWRRGPRRLLWQEPGLHATLSLHDGDLCGIEVHWGPAVLGETEVETLAPPPAGQAGPPAPDFLATEGPRRPRAGWALAAAGAVVLALAWAESGPRPAASVAEAPAAPDHPALQHPWGRVLVAGEQASARGLHWLELQHDAARPEIRLRGQAPDIALALGATDRLAAAPGVRAAALVRTEAGPSGLDFELQARLQPAAR